MTANVVTSAAARDRPLSMRCRKSMCVHRRRGWKNCTTRDRAASGVLLLARTIRLSRASDELELAALHLLFEHAEACLLLHVERLVDGLVAFPDFDGRTRIDLLQ